MADDQTSYHIIHVPISEFPQRERAPEDQHAEAPRYDRERDEPAFETAWKKVAEARARGEIKPVPPMPPGGIRLRGRRK